MTLHTHTHTHTHTESNLVITTLVYMTPRLYGHMFCGTNYFITFNHNILLLRYNDTHL